MKLSWALALCHECGSNHWGIVMDSKEGWTLSCLKCSWTSETLESWADIKAALNEQIPKKGTANVPTKI